MYSDHIKGFDKNVAGQAHGLLFAERMKVNVRPNKRQFDEYGDVIRDYKAELQMAYEDEQQNLLSQVGADYYNTINYHFKQRELRENAPVEVIILPQLNRQKIYAKVKQPVHIKLYNLIKKIHLPTFKGILKHQ